jgi:enoyl-CoA hydratase/carnithine racemase
MSKSSHPIPGRSLGLRIHQSASSLIPGAGGIQHLTRLMGDARALEVTLSADDYDADLAARYGWTTARSPPPHLVSS